MLKLAKSESEPGASEDAAPPLSSDESWSTVRLIHRTETTLPRRPVPLGRLPWDVAFVAFFLVSLSFITHVLDLERLVISDPAFLLGGSGSQPCLQCSGRPGGPAPPSAANHPGWPGGRRVYRRVGVPSLLAQQRHAQSVQTCRSGKTAPHYRQRVGRLTPATIRSSSWMEWRSHRKDFSGPEWSPRWGVVVGVANDDVAAVGGGWIFQPKVPGLRSQGRPPAAETSSS